MFKPVTSRVNFTQIEEAILEYWRQNRVFARSIEGRKNATRFVLYEGPPTANGSPGIHHILSRVFKDVIPRYKTMKGYYTPRIAGWDTHGLPVELEVEKELGFSSKTEIEKYGIDKFNARCRESVFRYLEEWNSITERIAFWVDQEHPYITMENSYIESCWWAIKQMWDKGLVYQGYRVTPHCPRCGTSLSSHEVAQGYQDNTEDPSVYIKFKVKSSSLVKVSDELVNKCAYLLAWTTTPWTLPGNTALAVASEEDYAVIELGDEYLIMADTLREQVGLAEKRVLERVKGNRLVNIEYEPLFNPHQFGIERWQFKRNAEITMQQLDGNLVYRVIAADFVSMEDGTGIVHIAPAFGEVDYEAGMSELLDFVNPVDLQGKIIGSYPFSGKFVKDADEDIIVNLTNRGLLLYKEKIYHTYPFCWRCDSPLLYYAKETWYIKTTAEKDKLISGNDEINWYPEHIKYGRFGDWLQNNVDWAFSRERYWGTPLPVWQCDSCIHNECISGLDELKMKPGFGGLMGPLDLHRPYVDKLTYNCMQCGGKMKRITEVIDCWFDSGAMPIAQWHYPFENKTLIDDGRFPADYVCEGVDQTRGWFYSLHAISILLFGRPSYKNVICLELILDAKGEKMSKAKGNVVEPRPMLDKYGADALRWYFLTSSPPGSARRFSEKLISEVIRQFMLTLWNIYSFFVTYANIDKFNPASKVGEIEPSALDCWIISELNNLIADVDIALEKYNPTEAGRMIESFVGNLSNWYVRRSRRRFWKSENDADKIAAYKTLYECLVTLTKLLAPFTPFLAEELYRNLVCSAFPEAPDSVHLVDFPVADINMIDEGLSTDTRLAIRLSSLGRAARSKAGIKVRQPLGSAAVKLISKRERENLERVKLQIMDEINIKELQVVDSEESLAVEGYTTSSEAGYTVAIATEITPKLAAEGLAREIVHRLQTMRRSAGYDIADYITTYYQGGGYIKNVMASFGEYIKRETLSRELVEGLPVEGVFTENYRLSNNEVTLAVVKEHVKQ
ncbi:MAG: isoleucine--tRNA ligase [Dehalococcoidia bacterium]|nr:MAG: isoleucine--tRNA ligase [Dehalococcoidia bacterium]